MPQSRARKAKKPRWQVVLGLKQVICGALGLSWMMIVIFILGVLAGRGDIYRWLSSWGLITPVPAKVAQWSPPAEAPAAAAPTQSPAIAPMAAPATQTPAPSTAAAPLTPITGSIASPPAPAPVASSAKKAKKGVSLKDQKAKEEELRRLRREVAAKLKFQNSFDSRPPKPAHAAQKPKEKAAASSKTPVRIAQYRDLKAAKAKVAELQKKGEKVALKQGKDKKGVFYDIVREAPANSQPAAALAQKPPKPSGNKSKKPTGAGN